MTQEGQAEAWHGNRSKYDWILYEPSVLRCAVGWHSFPPNLSNFRSYFRSWNLASSPATPVPHPSSIPRSGLRTDASTLGCFGCRWIFHSRKAHRMHYWISGQRWQTAQHSFFLSISHCAPSGRAWTLPGRKKTRTCECHAIMPFISIYIHYSKISQNTMQYAVYCDVSLKPLDTFSVSACISLLLNHSTSCYLNNNAQILVHDRSATARSWKSFSKKKLQFSTALLAIQVPKTWRPFKGAIKRASSCRASMLYLWGIHKKHGISQDIKSGEGIAWFLDGITECVRHRSHVQICLRLDLFEVSCTVAVRSGTDFAGYTSAWFRKCAQPGEKPAPQTYLRLVAQIFVLGCPKSAQEKRPLTQDMWHWKPTHHWWAKHPTSKMHVLIARFWITLLAKFWIFQAEQILETPTGLKVRTKWHLPRPKKWLDAVLGWRQGNNKETKRNNNYRTTRDI